MSQTNPNKLSAAAELPPVPDPGYEPKVSDTTLELWGPQLPVGVLVEGSFRRSITFKPYTMAAERSLSQFKKKNRNPAAFASCVLAEMIESVGPYGDFQELSQTKRRMLINQMYMADVLYAYILLRIEAMGEQIGFDIECPACGEKSRLTSDLNHLDIMVPDSPVDLVRTYKLRKPVKRGQEVVEAFALQPPRWQTVASMKTGKAASDSVALKFQIVGASIMSDIEGKPVHPGMIDQLTKRDFEHLAKHIDDNTPGPDLQIETECPACGHEASQSLRWDFDHFFGASSL